MNRGRVCSRQGFRVVHSLQLGRGSIIPRQLGFSYPLPKVSKEVTIICEKGLRGQSHYAVGVFSRRKSSHGQLGGWGPIGAQETSPQTLLCQKLPSHEGEWTGVNSSRGQLGGQGRLRTATSEIQKAHRYAICPKVCFSERPCPQWCKNHGTRPRGNALPNAGLVIGPRILSKEGRCT